MAKAVNLESQISNSKSKIQNSKLKIIDGFLRYLRSQRTKFTSLNSVGPFNRGDPNDPNEPNDLIELNHSAAEVARFLGISRVGVKKAVKRGMQLKKQGLLYEQVNKVTSVPSV